MPTPLSVRMELGRATASGEDAGGGSIVETTYTLFNYNDSLNGVELTLRRLAGLPRRLSLRECYALRDASASRCQTATRLASSAEGASK